MSVAAMIRIVLISARGRQSFALDADNASSNSRCAIASTKVGANQDDYRRENQAHG